MPKVAIEFDEKHLPVLISALETYSRLQTGQIKMALDNVYCDRMLDYDESRYIENVIRYVAFPSNPQRENDGHGGFDDQYNNVYNEDGEIVEESDEWKKKKHRPHLDHPNESFGVGCEECKEGTVCFEIKKQIEQYLHYKRNNGIRKICDVSGDGAMQHSNIPIPTIIGFEPKKEFLIPKKYQEKVEALFQEKKYDDLWKVVDKAFTKKPLPKGKRSTIKKNTQNDKWYVSVEEPYAL